MGFLKLWWAGLIVLFVAAGVRIGACKRREYEARRRATVAAPPPVRLRQRTPLSSVTPPVQPTVTEESMIGPPVGFFSSKDFVPVRYERLRAAPSADGRCLEYAQQCEGQIRTSDLLQGRSASETIFRLPSDCRPPPPDQALHLIVWRLTNARGRVLNVPTMVGIDFTGGRSRRPFNRLLRLPACGQPRESSNHWSRSQPIQVNCSPFID